MIETVLVVVAFIAGFGIFAAYIAGSERSRISNGLSEKTIIWSSRITSAVGFAGCYFILVNITYINTFGSALFSHNTAGIVKILAAIISFIVGILTTRSIENWAANKTNKETNNE